MKVNNKEARDKLRKKRFLASFPVDVKFTMKNGNKVSIKATKIDYVVKWSDVLKFLRGLKIEKDVIISNSGKPRKGMSSFGIKLGVEK